MDRWQKKRSQSRSASKPTPKTLSKWGKHFFPHHLTTKSSIFHDDLVVDLEAIKQKRGSRTVRIAPRGSAKSTHATLIDVIRDALEGWEPYQIVISDIQPNANKFLKAIKDEVENNEELRAAYPDVCCPGPVWREEAVEFPNGCRIEALGKGGKIRGRRHRQYRPTKIILDDPQSFDDAYSPTQMEKDFQWLNSDVLKAGSPETNFLVLGTALADECIVCKLEKTPGWDFKRYRSLIAEPKNMHLWSQWRELLYKHDDPQRDEKATAWYLQNQVMMDEGAQVLWPERFPLVNLMQRRYSEGERAFQSEEQGEPMPPGDTEWPMSYFDWPSFYFTDWPTDATLTAFALDPSKGKDAKQRDYQALCRGVRNRAGTIFIECWMERMDSQAMSEFMVDRWCEAPGEALALEENGFQELLRVPIEQAVKAKNASLRLPLVPILNTVKKEVRIRRLTPYLAQRVFRFRDTPGTRMLVDQLKKFPFAEHDDGPDSFEMLLRVLIDLSHVKRIV